MLTNPYTRHSAYAQAAMDMQELEEEERRVRQRAADEQAVQGAEETTRGIMAGAMKPAPVVLPASQQDNQINWGKAIGEAIGKVGAAAVSKLREDKPEPPVVDVPLPKVDLTPPRPPSESPVLIPSLRPEQSSIQPVAADARRLMALRPAESSDQLADVHEYTHRLAAGSGGGFERPRSFAPAPVSDVTPSAYAAGLRPEGATVERPRRFMPAPVSDTALPPAVEERLRQALRPEDVKPSRNLPAPGEEAANDARVREWLDAAGGFAEGGDSHTRARVAQPREYLERRIGEMEANPTHQNGNSRWWGALKTAGRGALQGFARTGTLAGAAGGAITGGVAGAVDKSFDEQLGEQDAAARYRAALQSQYEREGAGLKLDDARAGVRLKNAQVTDYESRPTERAEERRRKDADATRHALASIYNKLSDFDPADPDNAEMVESMREAGLPVVQKKGNQQLRFVQDARTGAWTVVAGDKQTGTATSAGVQAPGGAGQLTTTSPQTMSAEQQAANRELRERLAAKMIASRERIAAVNQAISRESLRLTQERDAGARQRAEASLRARHPGYGRKVTQDKIVEKYNQLKLKDPNITLEDVTDAAIEQGYEVER